LHRSCHPPRGTPAGPFSTGRQGDGRPQGAAASRRLHTLSSMRGGHRIGPHPSINLAVLPKRHKLSRRRVLDFADLAYEPLLLLHRTFGSRQWFEAAASVAHVRPRVRLESSAPHTLIALTEKGYGIAVVPSTVVPPSSVCAVPLIQRKRSIGDWLTVAWDAQRSLAAYAEQFVDDLVAYCRRDYPGRALIRRAPPPPRPRNSGV